MERCLITGASGFIGSALCQELSRQGCEILDVPHQFLKHRPSLTKTVKKFNPTWIFHLAAYGNKYDQQDTDQIVESNILYTLNLLHATSGIDYKAFINIGSSSEYGLKTAPMRETDALDSDTFYGATKASATMLCRAFAKEHDKPIVTVRPFSVYGPNEDPKKFIPIAIEAFMNDQPVPLASGTHDWIYIDDLIAGILTVAGYAKDLQGQAVNIGTGIQYSNHAVIGILREFFSKPGKIKRAGKIRKYDTDKSWVANIDLIKSLGWKPEYDLEKGLEKLVYGQSRFKTTDTGNIA